MSKTPECFQTCCGNHALLPTFNVHLILSNTTKLTRLDHSAMLVCGQADVIALFYITMEILLHVKTLEYVYKAYSNPQQSGFVGIFKFCHRIIASSLLLRNSVSGFFSEVHYHP